MLEPRSRRPRTGLIGAALALTAPLVVAAPASATWTDGLPFWPRHSTLTASCVGDQALVLSWRRAIDPPPPPDAGITGYVLYQDGVAIPGPYGVTATGGTTRYEVTGLIAQSTYNFTVEAIDRDGNATSGGPSVTVRTGTEPSTCEPLPDAPAGVYVQIGQGAQLPNEQVLGLDHINGFLFWRNWDDVEPDDDAFTWPDYEQLVTDAEAAGKQVILGIRPGVEGNGLPAWLGGLKFPCTLQDSTGPVPWDLTYATEYGEALEAMIEEFDDSPAVVGYAVAGFYQWNTMDFDLCEGQETNPSVEDVDRWLAPPYSYARWKITLAMAAKLAQVTRLTDKQVRIPVASMLNERTRGIDTASTKRYVVDPAYLLFGGDTVRIGRTVFDQNTPDPAGERNTEPITGHYELIYDRSPYIWGQRRPANQGGPVTAEEWEATLDIALHYKVQWFEIGLPQAREQELQGALACANAAMIDGSCAFGAG